MAAHKKYKVIIRKNISLKKKGDGNSIKEAPAKVYRDTGANLKVKIRRKGG